MEVVMIIIGGISLGILYICRSIVKAEEDPEQFDMVSFEQKLRKPEGWKTGKMPSFLTKSENADKKKLMEFS